MDRWHKLSANPVTEHRHRRGSRLVVLWSKYPPAKSPHTQRRKIIAGHILRAQRPARRFDALAPYSQHPAPGLERRHLFKFRRLRLNPLIQIERKHAPVVLRPTFHAAIAALAHAVQ